MFITPLTTYREGMVELRTKG